MVEVISLLAILGALFIGAVSPGPSFVLVSRIAVTASRGDGLAAALGMGVGGAAFAVLALFGLTSLLLRVEWLFIALRVLGGLYLIYLGIRIWRGASETLPMSEPGTARPRSILRSFGVGLITQVSNPKTAVVYASIFAALLPASPHMWVYWCVPPLVFLVEASWYVVVATVFSTPKPRAVYLKSKKTVDRLAAAVLGILGARLVSDAVVAKL